MDNVQQGVSQDSSSTSAYPPLHGEGGEQAMQEDEKQEQAAATELQITNETTCTGGDAGQTKDDDHADV